MYAEVTMARGVTGSYSHIRKISLIIQENGLEGTNPKQEETCGKVFLQVNSLFARIMAAH